MSEDKDAQIAALQQALDLSQSLYREAVGVPPPEHQQRRMEQLATELESALGRLHRVRVIHGGQPCTICPDVDKHGTCATIRATYAVGWPDPTP